MQIFNLTVNGKPVNNQYIIIDNGKQIFKSYDTIIATYNIKDNSIAVSNYWDYSQTTLKYFCRWLEQLSGQDKINKRQIETAFKMGFCFFKDNNTIKFIKS